MTYSQTLAARAEAKVIYSMVEQETLTGLAGLKACRKRAWISQEELAKITGISRQSIAQWEQLRFWPSAFMLPKLANALRCSIEELYLGPREENPEGAV